MDLIYYGLLFRSVIPVKDQKGFVRANTKRGLGSIKTKISGKIDRRPYRNFSQAIRGRIDWLASPKIRIVGLSFAELELDETVHLEFYLPLSGRSKHQFH